MRLEVQKGFAQIISIPIGYLIGAQIGHSFYRFRHPQVSFPSSYGFYAFALWPHQNPSQAGPS